MPLYDVTLPIAGTIHVEVEADSEKEAIDKAMEGPFEEDSLEWQTYRKLFEGNVSYVWISEAFAEEIDA